MSFCTNSPSYNFDYIIDETATARKSLAKHLGVYISPPIHPGIPIYHTLLVNSTSHLGFSDELSITATQWVHKETTLPHSGQVSTHVCFSNLAFPPWKTLSYWKRFKEEQQSLSLEISHRTTNRAVIIFVVKSPKTTATEDLNILNYISVYNYQITSQLKNGRTCSHVKYLHPFFTSIPSLNSLPSIDLNLLLFLNHFISILIMHALSFLCPCKKCTNIPSPPNSNSCLATWYRLVDQSSFSKSWSPFMFIAYFRMSFCLFYIFWF